MKIKKGRVAIINLCKYCINSYVKINREPCCSCIKDNKDNFDYKNFKRKEIRKVK